MVTKQSSRVAPATTSAEIPGCERTVPTLPSEAEVNWDINWKKLGCRNEKNHMWYQPELRGDVAWVREARQRSGVPQYTWVHHSESKWYRSVIALNFWFVSAHLCPMAAQAPTPSPAFSCPCSLQGWWAALSHHLRWQRAGNLQLPGPWWPVPGSAHLHTPHSLRNEKGSSESLLWFPPQVCAIAHGELS